MPAPGLQKRPVNYLSFSISISRSGSGEVVEAVHYRFR